MVQLCVDYLRSIDCTRATLHAAPLGKPVYSAMGFQMGHEMELKLKSTGLEVRATLDFVQEVCWWHCCQPKLRASMSACRACEAMATGDDQFSSTVLFFARPPLRIT